MPRTETILNIFVASPADVKEERESLVSIVSELNKTWSKNLNVRLELIKWETDIYPGFGEYPQDVINKQINDEYDIFLAIFWGKIGTATTKAESGTLEEFERAFARFKNNPKDIDILIYFKDHPISPSKMDYIQLQKIQNLKEELGEKGGLYWSFDNAEDFESLLRSHLSKVAQDWSIKLSSSQKVESNTPDTIEKDPESEDSIDEENDYGLLDYVEIYESRMVDMTDALNIITDATEKVSQQFIRRTDEINSLSELDGTSHRKKAKKIIKFTCDNMNRFSTTLTTQVSIVEKSRKDSFEAMSKALALQVEFFEGDIEDLLDLEKSLITMKESSGGTYEPLSAFRDTIQSLPPLTGQITKSKRLAVKSLNTVLKEIKATEESAQNAIQTVNDMKQKM